ncbi:Hypothetical Protein OBI_RACECAR_54 [Arthrobacter phage Racecar]|nr:hypothetical protein PBI_RACECAR_136 [Arthrobacter phage Racecar]
MSEDNRAPKPPYFKHVKFGLYALLLLVLVGWMYMLQLKMDAQSATNNTKTLAESGANSQFCDIYKQDDFCKKIKEIAENPTQDVAEANPPQDGKDGQDGRNGQNGAPGRGIQTFDSSTGNLVVKYTDNTVQNLGRIVGKDGQNGKNGTNGAAGAPGRGILAADLKDGALIVSYTDGSFQNVGNIVGPKGDTGATGAAGKDGVDGTPGKDGIDGKDGAPGKDAIYPTSVDSDLSGNVVISYSDGSTAQAGKIILPTVEIFTCENDTLTFKLTNDTVKTVRVDCSPDIANPPAAPQNNPATTILP